ncbi:MAG: hypothetical protein HYV63_09635 [Candidatus Schekmanbacteria bacterium]|nr:hypothetical protein [Candidatus Schekmanbacteria bacterium]
MPVDMDERRRNMFLVTLEQAKVDIQEKDDEIEKELAAVKERITELNAHKEAVRQIHDAACVRLGVESDLASEDEEDLE